MFKNGDIIYSLGLDMNCYNVEAICTFIKYEDESCVWYNCIVKCDGVIQYADSTDFVKRKHNEILHTVL